MSIRIHVCIDCKEQMSRISYAQKLVYEKNRCQIGTLYQCPRCLCRVVDVNCVEFRDKYALKKDNAAVDMRDADNKIH